MLSPVDYQELLEIHQSDYRSFGRSCSSNCFEKDVGLPNEMGKSRASALGVDGLAHQEMQDICPEISLYKVILTHQDCTHPKFLIWKNIQSANTDHSCHAKSNAQADVKQRSSRRKESKD
jgi:hypothetical protein